MQGAGQFLQGDKEGAKGKKQGARNVLGKGNMRGKHGELFGKGNMGKGGLPEWKGNMQMFTKGKKGKGALPPEEEAWLPSGHDVKSTTKKGGWVLSMK